MSLKTVTLAGVQVTVSGLKGSNAHIRNDGTEIIYASKSSGIVANADDVASIPAGQSVTLRGIVGTVYLLGYGSVLIQTDDYTENPFKSAVTFDSVAAQIKRVVSNPNLLTNPDFAISQRGETSWTIGTTSKYIVDRWYSARTNLSLSDDGLMLAWNGTDGVDGWIQQKIETAALFGKTVSVSVNVNDKIHTITDTIPETVNATSHKAFTGTPLSISLTNHGGKTFAVVLHTTSTTPSLIRWIKCELNSIATPFTPPDPATELSKCQRYYQIRSTGDIPFVDLHPNMRTTPTVTQLSNGNFAYNAEI